MRDQKDDLVRIRDILSIIEECGYPEEDLEFICRILEQIRINKEQVVSTGQMGLKI